MKNKQEIKRLKKEIAAFEESKKKTKVMAGCSAFFAILLCFCGIMAAIENDVPPSEPETSVSEQESTENTLLDITENTNSALVETQATEVIEAPTEEATYTIDTMETLTEDTSMDSYTETQQATVPPTPQKFRITWSAQLIDSNHVGSNWSKSFEVDDEAFPS